MLATERAHAEHWRRAGAGWTVSDLVGDATLPLDALGLSLNLRDIYAVAEA